MAGATRITIRTAIINLMVTGILLIILEVAQKLHGLITENVHRVIQRWLRQIQDPNNVFPPTIQTAVVPVAAHASR